MIDHQYLMLDSNRKLENTREFIINDDTNVDWIAAMNDVKIIVSTTSQPTRGKNGYHLILLSEYCFSTS